MHITRDNFNRIDQLWAEVSNYSVERMTEANLYLMRTLSEWLSADYAYWCGLVRVPDGLIETDDPLGGWRMKVTEPYKIPEVYSKKTEELHEDQHLAETVGMASISIMKEAGTFRARLLRDLVDLSEYEQSEHFERYQMPYGLSDRLYVVYPLGKTAESCFAFELAGNGKRISEEDAQLASDVLQGLGWFHRRLLLSHGLTFGDDPLNPLERTILLELLTGKSEKDIAAKIERARSTTHNYITAIFRRFEVNNRAGLMAKWVTQLDR